MRQSRSRTVLLASGLALVLTIASGGDASAQQPAGPAGSPTAQIVSEAKVHYERGTTLYNDGDFKLALIEFKRAYELAPNYKVLYNIGQVNLQLNNYAAALQALNDYLTQGAAEIPVKRRQQVEKDIAALNARTAHITVSTNVEGAEITIDDNAMGKSPLTAALVDAGTHRVSASKEGRVTASKTITLVPGDDSKLQLELPEVPVVPPAGPGQTVYLPGGGTSGPAPEQPPPPTSYVWVGWAGAGALAAGAVVTGVLAVGAKSDLNDMKGRPTTADELSSTRSRALSMAIVSDVFAVTAVAVGGVTLYFTLKKKAEPRAAAAGTTALRVDVGPRSVSLGGQF